MDRSSVFTLTSSAASFTLLSRKSATAAGASTSTDTGTVQVSGRAQVCGARVYAAVSCASFDLTSSSSALSTTLMPAKVNASGIGTITGTDTTLFAERPHCNLRATVRKIHGEKRLRMSALRDLTLQRGHAEERFSASSTQLRPNLCRYVRYCHRRQTKKRWRWR